MKYCIANWKMNLTTLESKLFLEELQKKNLQKTKTKIILCPSFTSLNEIKNNLLSNNIELGAQNVHQELKGAFTGEISIDMLKEIECKWVILGHSERRQYFNEEDVIVNDKLNTVVKNGLNPILCIGETQSQRDNNETFSILESQLKTALFDIDIKNANLVVAYEPIWAIGTGINASNNQINEIVNWICEFLLQEFSIKVPILYGGSVTSSNCSSIIDLEKVSGFLIGTSSLDVNKFYSIYSLLNER
tara:strand:- start:442 stop:1182 length:741 start_codon:yes stop_codon:yes gene_type:complete